MQALYVYLVGLDRYIDLNREGFRKALKASAAPHCMGAHAQQA